MGVSSLTVKSKNFSANTVAGNDGYELLLTFETMLVAFPIGPEAQDNHKKHWSHVPLVTKVTRDAYV